MKREGNTEVPNSPLRPQFSFEEEELSHQGYCSSIAQNHIRVS